jgi:hypothetical protein
MPYRGPILLGEILKFASPIGIRTYNPLVNNAQSPLRNAGVGGLFFGRIGGRYGERQELTWLDVSRIGSCMTK